MEHLLGVNLKGRAESKSTLRTPSGVHELEGILRQESAFAAPFFRFLESPYYPRSRWRMTADSRGLYVEAPIDGGTPSVYFQGDVEAIRDMMDHLNFPRHSYLSCFEHQFPLVQQHFSLRSVQHLLRMKVTPEGFVSKPWLRAVPIGADRIGAINELYSLDHGAWVTHRQVSDGIYYGVWNEGKLVSIAGTQAVSRPYRIAMVANVLTHPAYRGLGYATQCVGALTTRLLQDMDMVVLNVEPKNEAALAVYRRLGYQDAGRMVEAWAVWNGRTWWERFLAMMYSWLPA